MALLVDNLTNNVVVDDEYNVTGDGVVDKLLATVNTHIKAQFDANRIQNTDIANMYIGIVPGIIAQGIQFEIQREQIRLSKVPSVLK